MSAPSETFISIDVETAGPYPGRYSLLSIGACPVDDPQNGFYIELKPVNKEALESALHFNDLSLKKLTKEGVEPVIAMPAFADWIHQASPGGTRALMVGFNAPFDWGFINHYFLEYLGENPFGRSAVDIKAFYMGLIGVPIEARFAASLST